ncbi:MAG: alpha/beta hydrolase [Micropruina sp.]|nr:alpha/beta hydrolase [Micropruina sp.]
MLDSREQGKGVDLPRLTAYAELDRRGRPGTARQRWEPLMAHVRLLPAMAGVGAAWLAAQTFTRLSDPDLSPHPDPTTDFEGARARIELIQAEEARLDLLPEGHSIALLAERRTPKVVVAFHGYTSVPDQFRLIGEAYRAQGYNVWIPRLPHHGSADRMTKDFSRITPSELRDFADRSIDIAAGLGEEITVVGLSGGGALALWAGFTRAEVANTGVISPLLHPLGFADWQDRPLVRTLRLLPIDIYNWWDETQREPKAEGYGYPRFSLKGIAALLSLSHWIANRGLPPVSGSVLLVRNDGDSRLDGAYNERFVRSLVPADRLHIHTIPGAAGLGHDLVGHSPTSENYARLPEAYRQLSLALGILIPRPPG